MVASHPGELVLKQRKALWMSQNELAQRSGIRQSHISEVEAGSEARWTTYERLLAAMGTEVLLTVKRLRAPQDIIGELVAGRLAAEERARARSFSRRRRG
jgi:predicted transcriptional regulator